MPTDLTKVQAAVARQKTVKDSAVAFIRSVPGLIRDAIAADDLTDATNINALADDIESHSTEIEGALTENTSEGGGETGGVVTGDEEVLP